MSDISWSTCALCNTQDHETAAHPATETDTVPDSLYRQRPPAPSGNRDVLPLVMADYEARMRYYAGPTEYGVPLRVDNLRDHLRDAYAEALDLPGYLKAAMVLWDEMREAMGDIYRLADSRGSTQMLRNRIDSIRLVAEPYREP